MSDLSFVERAKLEKLFNMGSGYVLNFSNRTFQEFITENARRDIYCGKYNYASCSKANLLRKFWEVEPNHVIGKVIADLIELAIEQNPHQNDEALLDGCRKIADRLQNSVSAEVLEIVSEDLVEKDFDLLVKSIRTSIDANEPESGLDRLHTFVTKFLRRLCEKHGITISKDKPLHSLFGEYIKKMKADGSIETLMTERILKSSIANLEAFNSIRNDYSFAHDNPILNYDESLLIYNHVVSTIRFVQALEQRQQVIREGDSGKGLNDIPF